jgi:hypothetical protein
MYLGDLHLPGPLGSCSGCVERRGPDLEQPSRPGMVTKQVGVANVGLQNVH